MPPPYRRPDGSYVIQRGRFPYHVTKDDPLFRVVSAELDGRDLDPEPEPAPIVAPRVITPLALLERFTEAERIAIRVAARGASAGARRLDDALDLLRATPAIPLDSPRLAAFLAALVAAGLLAEARVADILA